MTSDELLLSNSEMQTFRRCGRKWYLSTYRRLKPRAINMPGSPFSIGNVVHDSLAAYYDPTVKADPVAFAHGIIDEKRGLNPELGNFQDKEEELIVIMLEGYLEWLEETGADQDLQVIGTETMAEAVLIPGVKLISKLDAPVTRISDGAKMALEHKTLKSMTVPLPLLKLDTQLLTEHLVRFLHLQEAGATAEEAQEACHGILYNMLRKVKRTASAKPPFYGREDVPHNIHELRAHWRHCVSVALEIQNKRSRLDQGETHHTVCPPSPTRNCTWDCDFFKICVMADDGSDFEGALHDLYEERDPLERYDDAAELEDTVG
jgi:hypothetical protein